jgi:hypothetical protein
MPLAPVAAITSFIVRSSRFAFTVRALSRHQALKTVGKPLSFPLPEGAQRGTANRERQTANGEPRTVSQVTSGSQPLGQAVETSKQFLVFVGTFLIRERPGFLIDLYRAPNEVRQIT